MSIESLKQQARRHEQNEEWTKALGQYRKALTELERDEQVDIGLFNRVGDLYVRVGQLNEAVEHYEKAVDLYREAYLPNNAIAVCKKIIRNAPTRHRVYLVIGQIRAEQGFLPDARTNFLTYAERMQQQGDLDESFRALIEFCDLAPDDIGVRITVAEQMAASGRTEEAVEQLLIAYRHYAQLGETAQAEELESKIREIDPEAKFDAVPTMGGFGGGGVDDDDEIIAGFGEISLGGDPFAASDQEEEISFAAEGAMEEASSDQDDDEALDLPMIGFDDGDSESAEAADPSTSTDFHLDTAEGEDAEDEEEAEPLPMMDFGAEDDDASTALEEAVEDAADEPEAMVRWEPEAPPPPPFPPSPSPEPELEVEVEGAAHTEEPETAHTEEPETAHTEEPETAHTEEPETAHTEEPTHAGQASSASPQRASESPPAGTSQGGGDQGYVDLGAMILGGSQEKSTRFKVAYEEPSGDEEADFAKMLSQFKEKVTENLDTSDVRAHYDLGTAYKEMGLLDEAISSFQAALRASADHLPTYEMMGQTFIEMGQPEAAVRSLVRAVQSADTVEDELVGIYYYLGRAYEALDNKPSAVEFYDRVFALDINFADVTERLRELR